MRADHFAEGNVAARLALTLIDDVVDAIEEGRASAADWLALTRHPLLSAAYGNAEFFSTLNNRIPHAAWNIADPRNQRVAMVGVAIARTHGSPAFVELAVKAANAALNAGDGRAARPLVRALEETLASSDVAIHQRRLLELHARLAAGERQDDAAIPLLREAVRACRDAGELGRAAEMLVDLNACLARTYDMDGALQCAEDAIELAEQVGDPRGVSICRGQRGNVLLALGRTADAKDEFERALQNARKAGDEASQSNWLGNLGVIQQTWGNYEKAVALHEAALQLSERIGDRLSAEMDHVHLADTFLAIGDEDGALAHARSALELAEARGDASAAERYRRWLHDAYVQRGEFGAARALEKTAKPTESLLAPLGPVARDEETPEQTDAEKDLDERFGKLMNADELGAAAEAVQAFLRDHPDSPVGHFLQARLHFARKQYSSAVESYGRAIELCPRWANAHMSRIGCLEALGTIDAAKQEYEQAVLDHPYDALFRTALGLCLSVAGDPDEALRQLRAARRLDMRSYTTARTLGEELFRQSLRELDQKAVEQAWATFDECLRALDDASELDPRFRGDACSAAAAYCVQFAQLSSTASMDMARLFNPGQRYGRPELQLLGRSVAYSVKALDASPQLERPARIIAAVVQELVALPEPVTLTQVGHTLRVAGRYEFARPLLELSLETERSDRLFLERRGLKAPVRPALEAETRYELGLVLSVTGDKRERIQAECLLRRAVELEPDNTDYRGALRRLERDQLA